MTRTTAINWVLALALVAVTGAYVYKFQSLRSDLEAAIRNATNIEQQLTERSEEHAFLLDAKLAALEDIQSKLWDVIDSLSSNVSALMARSSTPPAAVTPAPTSESPPLDEDDALSWRLETAKETLERWNEDPERRQILRDYLLGKGPNGWSVKKFVEDERFNRYGVELSEQDLYDLEVICTQAQSALTALDLQRDTVIEKAIAEHPEYIFRTEDTPPDWTAAAVVQRGGFRIVIPQDAAPEVAVITTEMDATAVRWLSTVSKFFGFEHRF